MSTALALLARLAPAARRLDPAYAQLALTTLLWSSNFVIGRGLRGDVSPIVLNTLRWAIAAAVLLVVTGRELWAHRQALQRSWKLVALLGLTGVAAFQTLVYVALTQTAALNAMLLLSLSPVVVALLSWATGGERLTPRQGLGLAASLAGATVLVLRGDLQALTHLQLTTGDLWMLAAVGLWGAYSVLLRQRPAQLPPMVVHAASAVAGVLWMLPLCLWDLTRGTALPAEARPWLLIAFVAVFSSVLAHGLWVQGVAVLGPNRASVFVHLIPLFGAVLAITFLGEPVAWFHAAGGAIVLAGVALASR
jgi:drug/metabolite transporter (DMT)-like permease